MYYREHYRRRLPHWQPRDAILFVTFRLSGTLPEAVRESTPADQRLDDRIRRAQPPHMVSRRLVDYDNGPAWLGQPGVAAIVDAAIRWRHKRVYRLHAYCIMPNHVHLVIEPLALAAEDSASLCDPPGLAGIMHSLKRRTAREANSLLGRSGPFWAREYHDHCVRDDDELGAIVEYVRWNPVSAGLVDEPDDWPWSAVFEPE